MVRRRRGARWPARDRSRRSPGCGPDRPGRSARRPARGLGAGSRRPSSATRDVDPRDHRRCARARARSTRRRSTSPRCRAGCRSPTRAGDDRPRPRRSAGRSATSMRDARAAPRRAATRSTASATSAATGASSRSSVVVGLDAASSSRSSMVRATRNASLQHPLGQATRDRRDRPRRPASRPAARARRPASSARG